MFQGVDSFNQPIGNWDVSNVKSFSGMFSRAKSFNQPIGNWDVSNVADMSEMFENSIFNQPLGNWNVSNVMGRLKKWKFYNNIRHCQWVGASIVTDKQK